MELAEIQKRIEDIKRVMRSDDVAHAWEDELYRALLEDLAASGPPPWAEQAKLALTVRELAFHRWYT